MISPEKPTIWWNVYDEIRTPRYQYRELPIAVGEEVELPRYVRHALPFWYYDDTVLYCQ